MIPMKQPPRIKAKVHAASVSIPSKIPLEDFAKEIIEDFPALYKDNPKGISFNTLSEYYGEKLARVKAVCELLRTQGLIQVAQTNSKAYFILPAFRTINPMLILTELQGDVLTKIAKACRQGNTTQLSTSYSQLSRLANCSYGGLKACMNRLIELGYLEIISNSVRGKQNNLIIGVKIWPSDLS